MFPNKLQLKGIEYILADSKIFIFIEMKTQFLSDDNQESTGNPIGRCIYGYFLDVMRFKMEMECTCIFYCKPFNCWHTTLVNENKTFADVESCGTAVFSWEDERFSGICNRKSKIQE